jgi:hypothetical protein
VPNLSPELLDVVAMLDEHAESWRLAASKCRTAERRDEALKMVRVYRAIAARITDGEHVGAHARAQKEER